MYSCVKAVDRVWTAYYIHSSWGGEINFCCFICITQWWALHTVIKIFTAIYCVNQNFTVFVTVLVRSVIVEWNTRSW